MRLPIYKSLTYFSLLWASACSSGYYSMDDFARVGKIDSHIHIRSGSTAFEDQARKDEFFLLDVMVDQPRYSLADQESQAINHIKNAPRDLKYVSAFSMQGWGSAQWTTETIDALRKSFGQGAVGVKVWKNIGMVERDSGGRLVFIDDPGFDPVIQFVIDQDKTVMGHLGEPKNCWMPLDHMTVNSDRSYFKSHPEYHMFLHPELPSYEEQVAARDRFLDRHPDMRFVGAHLGSLEWSVDELAKRLDKYPNMAVDMAARICHLQHQAIADHDKVRNFCIRYQDRLLYATDAVLSPDADAAQAASHLHDTWISDWKFLTSDSVMTATEVNGQFRGLHLPKEVIDKIYSQNARRWFKL